MEAPLGDLTEADVAAYLKEFGVLRGGAYKNKAHPLAAAVCPICGRWHLFSRPQMSTKYVVTCGRVDCMEKQEARYTQEY